MKLNGGPVRLYEYRGGQADDPFESPKCGTLAGYRDHIRNHDPRCDRCWRAHADYQREYRIRTGRHKSLMLRPTPAQLALLRTGQRTMRVRPTPAQLELLRRIR